MDADTTSSKRLCRSVRPIAVEDQSSEYSTSSTASDSEKNGAESTNKRSYILSAVLPANSNNSAAYISREWLKTLETDQKIQPAVHGIGLAGKPVTKEGLAALADWYTIDESVIAVVIKLENCETPPEVKNFATNTQLSSLGSGWRAVSPDSVRTLNDGCLRDLNLGAEEFLLADKLFSVCEPPVKTNPNYDFGRIGLTNLGNTCFMNSSLQALLHIPELAAYFLSQKYARDLNRDNPIGCGGEIADAFAKLVENVYTENNYNVVTPWSFRSSVGKFNQTFANRSQQDSQEFTVFLLDSLHEDLNRIHHKPATEKPELRTGEDPNDRQVVANLAKQSWKTHKLRNDSVIVDLFTGMYKSKLVCPICSKVNITFDPFLDLTLPLPRNSAWIKSVTIVPAVASEKVVATEISLTPNSQAVELRRQAAKLVSSAYTECTSPNSFACDVFQSKFYRVLDDNAILSAEISDSDTIFVYAAPDQETRAVPVYLRYEGAGAGVPFYIFISSTDEAEIRTKIAERLAQLHGAGPTAINAIRIFTGSTDYSNRIYSDSCLKLFWERPKTPETDTEPFEELFPFEPREEKCLDLSNDMYGSTISSPSPLTPNSFSDEGQIVDSPNFSEPSPLPPPADPSANGSMDLSNDFVLIVDLNMSCQPSVLNPALVLNQEAESAKEAMLRRKSFGLIETLKDFEQPEILGDDDLWYCPQCQDFRKAEKQMELWQLPDILMIHLKRFSGVQSMAHKVDDLIEFPLEGLDFQPFANSAGLEGNKEDYVYDLFAVDNHFGGMGGGHYTAYVRDPFSDPSVWLNFNDSHVNPIEESSVCSPAAYLLFYRRRNLKAPTENIGQIVDQLRSKREAQNTIISTDNSMNKEERTSGLFLDSGNRLGTGTTPPSESSGLPWTNL